MYSYTINTGDHAPTFYKYKAKKLDSLSWSPSQESGFHTEGGPEIPPPNPEL